MKFILVFATLLSTQVFAAGSNTYCCGGAPTQGTGGCSIVMPKCGANDQVGCVGAGGTWSSGWGGGMCSGYLNGHNYPPKPGVKDVLKTR